MYKDFVGKKVELILGFASYTLDGGSRPEFLYGEVLSVTDNSIKMSLVQRDKGKFCAVSYDGDIIEVNIKYVLAVKEISNELDKKGKK